MAASWLPSPIITLTILLISLAPSSSSSSCSPPSPSSNTITSSSSSSSSSASLSSTANNVSFVAHLIHITSPKSPFYDPNLTRENLIIEGMRTSLKRHQYFSQRYLNKAGQVYSKAPLNSGFLMNYSIGTPPFQTFGLLDTGSSEIWQQCSPCVRCDPQSIPIFFPSKSSTCKEVVCGSVECSVFGKGTITGCNGGSCNYTIYYGDGSYSKGGVFSDTLTLGGDVDDETIVTTDTDILVGCGYDNFAILGDDNLPGIIGVGNYSSSLLGQLLATQFSYLVLTNRDDDSLEGWVYFGQAASLAGFSTPLVPNDYGFYHLFLEAIYVNGNNLDLPAKYLQMGSDQSGGIIIDSGTTYTILNAVAFEEVRYEIEAYYQTQERKTYQAFEVCYEDIGQPPKLMFAFRDFNFTISQQNTWERFGLLFCLAILRDRDEESRQSTIGYYQQRDINIGYDLANYQLTFFSPDL